MLGGRLAVLCLALGMASATALAEPRVDELTQSMQSTSAKTRIAAVTALGRLEDKAALRPLVDALHDPNTDYLHVIDRALLLQAIGQARGPIESLALVQTIRALASALQAVLPYAETRVEDLAESASSSSGVAAMVPEPGPLGLTARAAETQDAWIKASNAVEDAAAEVLSLNRYALGEVPAGFTRPLAGSKSTD